MFANWVASTLHRYQDLLIAHSHPVAQRQRLSDAIKMLHAANPNGGSRAQEAEVTWAMEALMKTCLARDRASVITDIIIRLTCDSLQDHVIQTAVKKWELEGATVHEVQETIKMTMKAQAGWLTTANKEFKLNPSAQPAPKLTASTEVVSSDWEGAEMAAIAGKARAGTKHGRKCARLRRRPRPRRSRRRR
jgi:hypothetical protein